MSIGVAIKYGNFAPEAKENFAASSGEEAWFVDLSQLQQYNLDVPNYANPCEMYNTLLDGSQEPFPTREEIERNGGNFGFVSDRVSTTSPAQFWPTIELVFSADGQYTSDGITLTFDIYNNIYPRKITLTWYRDLETLESKSFDVNSPVYFCQQKVENYNKIKITVGEMNMENSRFRLFSIDYGYGTVFYGDELRNVKLIQEIDPISSEISINTADFTLDSKRSDMVYSFQAKQPLSVYFNDKLLATTFVKSAKRQAKRLWQIQSEDYIGIMDTLIFNGGMYVSKNAVELLKEIFTTAKVPYSIGTNFNSVTVTGYLPYATCREALMQVAFAIGAVVDTSNSDVVKVFSLNNAVQQTIPLNRIMSGQNFVDDATVTGVEVTAHTYRTSTETVDAYKAEDSGTGENIFVSFTEPLHSLSIVNGEILKEHTNYAIINADEGCVLTGKKYEHSTTIKRQDNPLVLASEIENIVAVTDATLVSSANIDSVLNRCYNWLIKTNTTNLKIVERKHVEYGVPVKWGQKKWGTFKWGEKSANIVTYDKSVNVGEVITAETEYLGNVTGRIIKQTFNLNGGIIVKDAVMK